MGGGASSAAAKYKAGELTDDEALAALRDLPDEDKGAILEILQEPPDEMVRTNSNKVIKNKARLYSLEGRVLDNKTKLYAERAKLEENRAHILSNYSAAFMGNRQMANQNTDDIFRNKMECIKLQLREAVDPIQKNYLESRLNQMRIEAVDHRVKVNARLAKVNEMMDKVNASLSDINEQIMEGNEEIVNYNTALFSLSFDCAEASKDSNAERISANDTKISELEELAQKNTEAHDRVLESAKEGRARILQNTEKIHERREKIEENHGKVIENTAMIAQLIEFS